MRWFVRGCFTLTWTSCLVCMGIAETGTQFTVASGLFVVVPFVYVAMLEEVDG